MRTTVNIDDNLLASAKRRAAARNLTLGEFVEEAVRQELIRESAARAPISLPVFTRGTGMRPGIDGSSNRALFDALDADGAQK
ncbi:type II toxin-antitoxin system VapB family antitoxin [Agromyces sp. NPDC058484]|uniref:type II toxin-antitoxin system VapB family antitoxin n=1 Tax=Agromyces sp. NPDC058484 TaxID=3346524 RepID=UPI00365AB86E